MNVHLVSSLYADAAASEGRHQDWMQHLNRYLDPSDVSTGLHLEDGAGPLLGRLSAKHVPAGESVGLRRSGAVESPEHRRSGAVKNPVVSVILVALNAADTLEYAARSILQQTWTAIELIIVDDASTDDTWSLAQTLREPDERVKLMRNPVRVGPYVSRNLALGSAPGTYVTCHDADDWAHPDRLAGQVGPLVAPRGMLRASLAYMLRVQPDGRLSTEALSWFCPDGATKVAMVSAMYERRLLVDELGYWDGVWYGADAEMIGRAQALLGKAGFAEVRAIAMLCHDAAAGLGKAGYNDVQTVADDRWTNSTRHRYRNAFSAWHARVAASRNAYLPFHHHKARLFIVPDGMAVDERAIRANGVRAGLRE